MPGQAGVKSLAQGDYEDNYNKDAKAIPGCCDPLADGSVSHCHKAHDVEKIPYCAVDGIFKQSPLTKEDYLKDAADAAAKAAKSAEKKEVEVPKPVVAAPKAKDKFNDVLTQVADYDIQNPTLKVTDKPSAVKTSIKGKGCTAEPCSSPRAPCCKVAAEPEAKKDDKAKTAVIGLAQDIH